MRVAVNLTWLATGRVGGSEEYLARQLAGLPSDGPAVCELYCTASFAAAHPDLAVRFDVRTTPFDRDNRALRIALEHSWLAVRTRHADVVHHGGGTTPMVGARPIVLTVHDLQFLAYPQYFGRARRRYLDAMVPRSIRRAAVVAAPSRFVRTSIIDAYGADPDRVVVVPHGIPPMERPDDAAIEAVRHRFGLGSRPYVVYPAITHPHKRHRVLVDMLDFLDDDTILVLLGGEGAAETSLRRTIDSGGHSCRVVRPGRVSGDDRDALVAGADALVFPSEYEGFGAPLIEAMALDTPVVCSDADAVREVVANAAVIVDEPTGEAWADGVGRARRDTERLTAAGRRRRDAFTIATSGAALLDAYRAADREVPW